MTDNKTEAVAPKVLFVKLLKPKGPYGNKKEGTGLKVRATTEQLTAAGLKEGADYKVLVRYREEENVTPTFNLKGDGKDAKR